MKINVTIESLESLHKIEAWIKDKLGVVSHHSITWSMIYKEVLYDDENDWGKVIMQIAKRWPATKVTVRFVTDMYKEEKPL